MRAKSRPVLSSSSLSALLTTRAHTSVSQ